MYSGHSRLCVCVCFRLSVPCRIPTLLHRPVCNLVLSSCALLGRFAIGAWVSASVCTRSMPGSSGCVAPTEPISLGAVVRKYGANTNCRAPQSTLNFLTRIFQ